MHMGSGHRSIFRQAVMFFLFATLLAAGTGIGSAHAPITAGSGEGLAGATLISSPEKSYVLNTVLDEDGDPRYYRFILKKGQILYGSLQVPGPDSSIPDLVIIGPGIEFSGSIPSSIEVPAGSGAVLVPGRPPGKPSYEPFTPQPIYESARFNVTAYEDGNYYVVVAGPGGTKFSLAPGFREEFTAMEWLLIPWSVIFIHLWEGQSPLMVFAPGGTCTVWRAISGNTVSERDPEAESCTLVHPGLRPPVPGGSCHDRTSGGSCRPANRVFFRGPADLHLYRGAVHSWHLRSPGRNTFTRS